ncbi:MAG: NAD(P)-dependent oxidoreductase [Rhodocyclaceae bacterium]|nr:NAD(P)-dependent oxidoreductase [Rhodocyclaceae bacterium]
MAQTVAMIGLGIMGSAISANLVKNGFTVLGFDVSDAAKAVARAKGVTLVGSPKEAAAKADVLLLSLPSVAALDAVVAGADGILDAARGGIVVAELSTLPIEDKQRSHDALAAAGITMLDCPLSGTGGQAVSGDLSVYMSGDAAAAEKLRPVFAGFSRQQDHVGPFGNGMKMKAVANMLVAIHNVAAAEAFVFGMKMGLDPESILKVAGNGAGGSRMFEVRGPMMVKDEYPATMKVSVWQKDMHIIGEMAKAVACPTPLLNTSAILYDAAMAQGRSEQDTGSVCAVLGEMARLKRVNPAG